MHPVSVAILQSALAGHPQLRPPGMVPLLKKKKNGGEPGIFAHAREYFIRVSFSGLWTKLEQPCLKKFLHN